MFWLERKNGQVGKKYLTSSQRLERPPFPQILFPPPQLFIFFTPMRNKVSISLQRECEAITGEYNPRSTPAAVGRSPGQHRQPDNKVTQVRQLSDLPQLHSQLRNRGDPGHMNSSEIRGITVLPTTGLGRDLSWSLSPVRNGCPNTKKQKEKQRDQRTHHPLRHVKSWGALIAVPVLHSAGLGNIRPEAKGKADLEMPGFFESPKAESNLVIQKFTVSSRSCIPFTEAFYSN